jgi:dethiobiotin synthetase/adenosylmethionine--8-amino-7-oxononanoate aminotransferase
LDGKHLPDDEVQRKVHQELSSYAGQGPGVALVETAGGVLSPSPSGSIQADLYRPLRMPVLLVGDSKLGGIATTISAFESLHLRGYDVESVVLFKDGVYQNFDYLEGYFEKKGILTHELPPPPNPVESLDDDAQAMQEYYHSTSQSLPVKKILGAFTAKHESRLARFESMPAEAHSSIWYPFTQHQGRTEKDIMVIDSAYGDDFSALTTTDPSPAAASTSVLQPAMDGSASWWTQGLGHGNPKLSLAAAYAAGRYGHVMFASAINEPSLSLAQLLLKEHQNPRLSKVYYTDNGSTGMEVGIKMGLRAACVKYGWDHRTENVEVLGLKGSYHGDTMGVMDASEPSVYNDKVEWYKPRGCKFQSPFP